MALTKSQIEELCLQLGDTLVALGANVTDRALPKRWITGQETPADEQALRLSVMHEVFNRVAESEGSNDTARAWFIGGNCHGMTTSPCEVIREGDFAEARISATRFMEGAYD